MGTIENAGAGRAGSGEKKLEKAREGEPVSIVLKTSFLFAPSPSFFLSHSARPAPAFSIFPLTESLEQAKHCWTQHVACVWPPFYDVVPHVGCCWLKFEND